MSSVPMPRDLSEEAVRKWIRAVSDCDVPAHSCRWCLNTARAVRALLREKVRECIAVTESRCYMPRFASKDKAYGSIHPGATDDEIVSRVLGEEAPRG